MENVARIVLGLEAGDVAEEVMHFLDRTGRTRVVATAVDERQLAEAVRQLEPDAVVASPGIAQKAGDLGRSVLLAVDTYESVNALRRAIKAGARGFYLWPADRDELAGAAARMLSPALTTDAKRALVVAVYGARGGAGTTFLATHLASAFRRQDREVVLIDLDLDFADVTAALAAPADERTVADALPLGEELTEHHLDEILWVHPDGFRVLLAPGEPEAAMRVRAADCRVAIAAARAMTDVVVLHVPRTLDEMAQMAFELADRVLVVLSLDVLSFRDAKRVIAAVADAETIGRFELVVNRAGRAEITVGDVARVFGRPPLAVIARDASAPAAQDRGRLLPKRGRAGRALDRLATRLLEEA
jgi:Flp pilus assembly CpaE family ATPase